MLRFMCACSSKRTGKGMPFPYVIRLDEYID